MQRPNNKFYETLEVVVGLSDTCKEQLQLLHVVKSIKRANFKRTLINSIRRICRKSKLQSMLTR